MSKTKPFIPILRLDTSQYFSSQFLANEEQILSEFAGDSYYTPDKTRQFAESLDGPCILITNSDTDLNQWPQSLVRQSKLLIHPNSGHDNLLPYLDKMLAPIIGGNPIRAQAVANYILTCIFDRYQALPRMGNWDPKRQYERKLLSELNIQLIGVGHIGGILQSSLGPLAKNLFCFDPHKGCHQWEIGQADIVIMACSLTPETLGMADQDFFAQLKNDVTFINGARGKLTQLSALTDFLKVNKEAFAYLDVFESEPYPLEELRPIQNLYTSSHIAGVYSQIEDTLLKFEYQVIKDFMQLEQCQFFKKYRELHLNSPESL